MRVLRTLVTSSIFMALLAQEESVPQNRRLIINGVAQPVEDFPYVVSLMICSLRSDGRAKGGSCRHFCTGSLIAPDVVLTAGHCVVDDSAPWGVSRPLTDLRRIRVLLGATYSNERPARSKLVKVREFANAGYNQNRHFPMDNDVGLFFLDQCLSPRSWPPVKISTPDRPLDDGCSKATLIGWGKHKAIPDLLYKSNSRLHSYVDTIQPYPVCRQWYVETHSKHIPRGLRQPVPMKELYDTISPDRHLCHGGDSLSSTCFGDSGGPLLVADPDTGDHVVVGVTSFGIGKTCGGGPSFVARVSTYATWIENTVRSNSECHKYDGAQMFLTYPLTDRRQSATDRTGRCGSGKWQCVYSGSCIDARGVCDGRTNCDDGSDEDEDVCKGEFDASNTESLPPPIELVAAVMGFEVVGVEDSTMEVGESSQTEDVEEEASDEHEFTVADILPEGVYLNTREMSKWREKNDEVLIHYTECPAAFALMQHVAQDSCSAQYASLISSIKRAGTNPRAVPKYLLEACDGLTGCIGAPGPRLLVAWIKHCEKAPLRIQRPPKWIGYDLKDQLKFCLEARSFAEDEANRAPNALEFKARYGHYCPA